MNLRAVAASHPSPRVKRPRIIGVLVRRELDPLSGVLLLLASAGAAAAAFQVHGPGGGDAMLPMVGQSLRRFDLTILAAMAMFLVLRAGARIDADHASGWLPPFVAAGGSRRAYGLASIVSALLAPTAIFAAAALTFAGTVTVLTGDTELLRALPRTLGSGILVLGSYSVCTVAIGVALRRAAATAVAVGMLVALPLLVVVRHGLAETAPPLWTLWLQLLSPLLFAPADVANALRAAIYIAAGCAVTAVVSQRYTGRTS
jgi:hypothetical protein